MLGLIPISKQRAGESRLIEDRVVNKAMVAEEGERLVQIGNKGFW